MRKKYIEFHIEILENNLRFISKYILPHGKVIRRLNENDIELSPLKVYENFEAMMIYSDGRKRFGKIHGITEDDFLFTGEWI
jgi:hypothetical protein